MSTTDFWGVWCQENGKNAEPGWFRHSEGTPIHYHGEAEARSVASGLQLLLPDNHYEVRPMPEGILSTLVEIQTRALIAAKEYIEGLEAEVTGNTEATRKRAYLSRHELSTRWVDAQQAVTEAVKRESEEQT